MRAPLLCSFRDSHVIRWHMHAHPYELHIERTCKWGPPLAAWFPLGIGRGACRGLWLGTQPTVVRLTRAEPWKRAAGSEQRARLPLPGALGGPRSEEHGPVDARLSRLAAPVPRPWVAARGACRPRAEGLAPADPAVAGASSESRARCRAASVMLRWRRCGLMRRARPSWGKWRGGCMRTPASSCRWRPLRRTSEVPPLPGPARDRPMAAAVLAQGGGRPHRCARRAVLWRWRAPAAQPPAAQQARPQARSWRHRIGGEPARRG